MTAFVKAKEKEKFLMHEMRARTRHFDIQASLYFPDAILKTASLNVKVRSEGPFKGETQITCHKTSQ